MAGDRGEIERAIRARCDAHDASAAASEAIKAYGGEIFGFLLALHRDEDDASEVFSRFTELVWRGIDSFAWQCSFRTWAYAVARNASLSYRREERRRARVQGPLPEGSELSAIAQQVKSESLSSQAAVRRTLIAQFRDSLPPDDRALLVLRVDKQLAWNDLVRVLQDEGAPTLDDESLKREAARLRKRFQLVKERLLDMGRRRGLVDRKRDR